MKYTQFLIEEELRKLPIMKFFLSGSRAFGWEKKDSDWDYVVFPSTAMHTFKTNCQNIGWKRIDNQGYYHESSELDPVTFFILEKELIDTEKVQLQVVNKNGYLIKKVVLRYLKNLPETAPGIRLKDNKKFRGMVWKQLITETLNVSKEMKVEYE